MQAKKELNAGINNLNTAGTNFNSLLNMSDSPITEIEPETEGSEAIPQSITQSLELGGENSKEITFDEASSQLQCDDPWLQRKMAEKQM